MRATWRGIGVTALVVMSAAACAVISVAMMRSEVGAVGELTAPPAPGPASLSRPVPLDVDAPGDGAAADGETGNETGPRTDDGPQPAPVTLAFGGDVHAAGPLAGRLADEGPAVLGPLVPMLAPADLAVVNVETAITDGGTPAPKEFNFRADPALLSALRDAGVDVGTVANNHGMDYGLDGLVDTIAAGRAVGLPLVGIGMDAEEAYRPWIGDVGGWRIAVLGATQVLDSSLLTAWTAATDQPGLASAKDVDRLAAEVAAVRGDVDTVVVFLHWGVEGERCPSSDQQSLADRLVAAGADVIVGGHAHRVQAAGRKGDALVAYGLGNFVFAAPSAAGGTSGVLTVTVAGRDVLDYRWTPARLRNGVATALDGAEAEAALEEWDALRDCTDLQR